MVREDLVEGMGLKLGCRKSREGLEKVIMVGVGSRNFDMKVEDILVNS